MIKILNSKQFKNILFSLCILGFLFLIFNFCDAAVLYLSPSSGEYNRGDIFIVEARLDTQGEYINAIEANLNFPSDILKIQNLSQGNSILTLWIKEPSFSNNTISFIGGTPAGYQGPDGLMVKIVFQVQEQAKGSVKINFQDDSKVLLNDGKGTEAKLSTKGGSFNILAKRLEVPKDQWQKELEQDKIAPLPFKIEISQNPAILEGKYFITFSTTDKETGIDYFEVKEGKMDWGKVVSPYVLNNQELTDDIWVKAIDKAGNEWIEILKAPKKPIWEYVLYGGLVLILLSGIIILVRKLL